MRRRFNLYASLDGNEGEGDGNNIITYTSFEGNIVTPNSPEVFGATIISNTYDTVGQIVFDNDVLYIGESAFYTSTNLISINIPNSVVEIRSQAFAGCTRLTDIKIPDSVTSMENHIFYVCVNLSNITLPKSITSIKEYTFCNCQSLVDIEIPDSVTSIEEGAFWSCIKLASIVIPSNVTSIGNIVFENCSKLTSVYIKATTPPTLGNNVFNGHDSDRKIYVPRASLDAYKTASGWKDYADAIEPYDY